MPPEGLVDVLVEGWAFATAPARRGMMGASDMLLLGTVGLVEGVGCVDGPGGGGCSAARVRRVGPSGA